MSDTQALLTPDDYLGEKKPVLPETFFLFFHDSQVLKDIQGLSKPLRAKGIPGVYHVYKGMGFRKMLMGADMSAFLLELLAACGVKKTYFFGTACLLDDMADGSSLHIIDMAIREEGVSTHYGAEDRIIAPQKSLNCEIHLLSEKLDIKVEQAISVSTAGVFRETEEKVVQWKKEGATLIDMEASAMFAVANFLDIAIGYVTSISDRISEGKWKRMDMDFQNEKKLLKAMIGY